MNVTPNTQATLLLTAPLIIGKKREKSDHLTLGEFNKLARILSENKKTPADLLDLNNSDLIEECSKPFGLERIEALLGRGYQLSQALEKWHSKSIWVISRGDPNYPVQIKERLKSQAPTILYGCGDLGIIQKKGFAVVGSRKVDENLRNYTLDIGAIVAKSDLALISGGARGIDQSAMNGALRNGGKVVGVTADSLEKTVLSTGSREALHDKMLLLLCPYDPSAGFNVGNAMQRNKVIYALSDAALIVNVEYKKGGTWNGAVEQLNKYNQIPLFVRTGEGDQKGCLGLIELGAINWEPPDNSLSLIDFINRKGAETSSIPEQGLLPLMPKSTD